MTATLRAGDLVRVVLEGQVVDTKPHGAFAIRNLLSWIEPNGDYLKSVEILKPAKPSVADLPVGSAVRDSEGIVFVKLGANMPKPWSDQWGARYCDADVDLFEWTLLVEATNG